MGNLEKAGVLVVVALLAVILVVAFMNNPEEGNALSLDAKTNKMVAGAVDTNQHPQVPQDGGKKSDPPAPKSPPNAGGGAQDEDHLVPHVGQKPADPPKESPVVKNPAGNEHDSGTPPTTDPKDSDKRKVADAPAPTDTTGGYPKKVKVTAKDTSLWALAVHEYGAKTGPKMVKAIQTANPGLKPEAMKIGQELTLPPPPAAAADATAKAPDADKSAKPAGDGGVKPTTRSTKKPAVASKPEKPHHLPFVPQR